MARSVMAAIWGLRPAMSASSSRHSTLMMVESMSAISSFLRRCAVGHQIDVELRGLRHSSRAAASAALHRRHRQIEGMAGRQDRRRARAQAREQVRARRPCR